MAEFAIQRADWHSILSVSGDLARSDMDNFLRSMVDAAAPRAVELLIVDLSNLIRIGSSGMRALSVATQNLAEQGQRLVVSGVRGEIQETFAISRIDTILTVAPDIKTAQTLGGTRVAGLRLAHSS